MKTPALTKRTISKKDAIILPFVMLFVPLFISMISDAKLFPAILLGIFGIVLLASAVTGKFGEEKGFSIFIRIFYIFIGLIFLSVPMSF